MLCVPQEIENRTSRPERLVEVCVLQGSGELRPEQSVLENGENDSTRIIQANDAVGVQSDGSNGNDEALWPDIVSKRPQKKRKRYGLERQIDETKPKTIDELIYCYPCCPPDAFFNIPEFFANRNVNWIDLKDLKCRIPIRNWIAALRRWTVEDYHKYYNDPKVYPYFNAYGSSVGAVYYSISESVAIAKRLLNYQFGDDADSVQNFVQTLYNVVDKKIPKVNSLLVKSPPSAGKNFFFDAVASYFLSYGMFGTANKNNNFSWADGFGKRLVLWNEPNYEQYHLETIKELLGGDTTRIKVKYMDDVSVQRVPVILLTNNHLNIISHPAFKDRLCCYEWMSAPFLKQYDKKLHPLMFYELLKEFGLVQ